MIIINRTYYSLEDLLIAADYSDADIKLAKFGKNKYTLSTLLNSYVGITTANQPEEIYKHGSSSGEDSYSKELWDKYIVPYYMDECITYHYNNTPDYIDWLSKFVSILIRTHSKYATVISNYESNKAKLLDKVKSITTSNFNDTPQTSSPWTSGSVYISTTRQDTVESDVQTLMQRLDEINIKLKNYYTEWAKQFSSLFIDSAERE